MKRQLTAVAAAALALGMMAPAAFAATGPNYNHRTITIGSYSVGVAGIQAADSGNQTEFIPFYYLQQGLQKLGYTVTWDGKNLHITTPSGTNPNLTAVVPNTNDMVIYINGTPVQNAAKPLVAKDPASGVNTSYLPIYYFKAALNQLGFNYSYDGSTWSETQASLAIKGNGNISVGGKDNLSLVSTDASGSSSAVSASDVSWSVDGNGNAFVDANGNFTATQAGTYTVTAAYEGQTATAKVVVSGEAASLAITTAQPSLVADGQATEVVTVQALDANGNVATDYNGTATIDTTGAASAYSTAITATGVTQASDLSNNTLTFKNGVATVVVQAGNIPGITGTFTVNSNDIKDSTGTLVTSTAKISTVQQVATAIKVTPAQNVVSVNNNTTATFNVSVVDQQGQPMLGGYYSLTGSLSGGTFAVDGKTSGETILFTPGGSNNVVVNVPKGQVGTYTLTVAGTGLAAGSGTVTGSIAGNAAKVTASVDTNSDSSFVEGAGTTVVDLGTVDANGVDTGTSGLPASGLEVFLTDSQGNAYTNATVTPVGGSAIAAGSDNGYVLPAGTTSFSVSDGSHKADAGKYSVVVKDTNSGGLSASAPLSFTEEAQASPTQVVLSVAKNVLSNGSLSTTVTAQLADAFGNPVAGNGDVIQFSASPSNVTGSTGSASFNSGTASTSPSVKAAVDSTGKASVTFNAQDYNGTDWTITAADQTQSLTTGTTDVYVTSHPVNSFSFTARAANNSIYVPAGQSVVVSPALVSSALDVNGNATNAGVDNVTLTISHASGIAGLLSATSTPSVTVTTNSTTDTATLTGSLSDVSAYVYGANWTAAKAGTVTLTLKDNSTGGAGSTSFIAESNNTVQSMAVAGVSDNQTLTAGSLYAVTFSLADLGGNPMVAPEATTVTINGAGFQLEDANHVPQTSLTIAKGQTSVTGYIVAPSAVSAENITVTGAVYNGPTVTGTVYGVSATASN